MTQLTFTPVTSHLASSVSGIDLSAPLDTARRRKILFELAKRKVLVFPDQHLSARTFHDYASGFGELQVHVLRKYRHADFPGLSWLTNVAADGGIDAFGVKRATTWHSDGSYSQYPPAIGILYALEVPETGGGTLFADMSYAYERLEPALKDRKSTRLNSSHSQQSRMPSSA